MLNAVSNLLSLLEEKGVIFPTTLQELSEDASFFQKSESIEGVISSLYHFVDILFTPNVSEEVFDHFLHSLLRSLSSFIAETEEMEFDLQKIKRSYFSLSHGSDPSHSSSEEECAGDNLLTIIFTIWENLPRDKEIPLSTGEGDTPTLTLFSREVKIGGYNLVGLKRVLIYLTLSHSPSSEEGISLIYNGEIVPRHSTPPSSEALTFSGGDESNFIEDATIRIFFSPEDAQDEESESLLYVLPTLEFTRYDFLILRIPSALAIKIMSE